MNCTNREQPGNYLRKPLGNGTGMSIRTSTILRNWKRLDRGKNESPQQFADRCKDLAQKVMIKSADPLIQRIHKENADRMLLASFVSGLTGTAGYQVRISHPKSLGEALNLAVSVQEAERQQRFNESFYTRSEKSVRLLSEPKGRPDTGNGNRRYSGETRV